MIDNEVNIVKGMNKNLQEIDNRKINIEQYIMNKTNQCGSSR